MKKKMLQVNEETHSLIKLQAVRKNMSIMEYLDFLAKTIEKQFEDRRERSHEER